MAKVFIFGMAGVIVIGLIMLLIFGGSLATKLASLFWRGKKNKEESNEGSQDPRGPLGRGRGSDRV